MNLKYTSKERDEVDQLHARTRILLGSVRKSQADFVDVLATNIGLQAYLILGYSSLFEYLVKEFDMTSSTAWRYSNAAFLVRDYPENLDLLRSGQAALSTLAELRCTLVAARKQGKAIGNRPPGQLLKEDRISPRSRPKRPVADHFPILKTKDEERAFVASIATLSIEDATEKLNELRPPKTSVRKVTHSAGGMHLHLVLSKEEEALLNRLREVWGHRVERGDWAALIVRAVDFALEKEDPMRRHAARKVREIAGDRQKPDSDNIAAVPKAVRDEVMARDGGACQFIGPEGRKCLSKDFVDIDHVIPRSKGGSNRPENLRCLCAQHNRRMRDRAESVRLGLSTRDPPSVELKTGANDRT